VAGEADGSERTEAATPRRLERAREAGQIALSREVAPFVGLTVAMLVLATGAPAAARALAVHLSHLLAAAAEFDPDSGIGGLVQAAAGDIAWAVGPLLGVVLLAGVAASALQTGLMLHLGALQPDLSRINPLAGVRRLFGMDTALEAARSLLKVAAAGALAWTVARPSAAELTAALSWSAASLADRLARDLVRLMAAMLAVQAVITAGDIVVVRFRHAQRMRMSREDVREEAKESDGNPQVKSRLRQLRQQRARRRMLAAVPKATVVITNPTHYAVALAYDRATNPAPRVVAKGVDAIAARIRAVAEEHRVPVIANPPLARALHAVELDATIPAEHYKAVAEIIAYVWRLGRRAGRERAAPIG
jgi:flagellar biosynthetic protein FlhB